jgi:hypothetical protein
VNSPLLNYIIELGVAGYIDNPNYVVGPTQRMQLLSERVRYWKEMTWNERVSLQTPGIKYGNDIRYSRAIVARPVVASRSTDAGSVNERVYEVKQLGCRSTDSEQLAHTFTIPIQMDEHRVLAIDPGQELLITFLQIKYHAHFLAWTSTECLSSRNYVLFEHLGAGSRHKEAAEYAMLWDGPASLDDMEVQILGCLIVISSGCDIWVCNWRNDERLFVSDTELSVLRRTDLKFRK